MTFLFKGDVLMRHFLSFLLPAMLCCASPMEQAAAPDFARTQQIDEVRVTPDSLSLHVGDIGNARCEPTTRGQLVLNTCTWVSRDTTIATVVARGTQEASITGRKLGKTWVVTTAKNRRDSVFVHVCSATGDVMPCVDLTPPPPSSGAACPESGYLRLVNVDNVAALRTALNNALPGDLILIAAGAYNFTGLIEVGISGTVSDLITICGPRTAIFNGGGAAGTWFDITASYVRLRGFRITQTAKGIHHVSGSHNIYEYIEADHVNTEAVMIQGDGTTDIELGYLDIHDTGLGAGMELFGEGVYLGKSDGSHDVSDLLIHHLTVRNTTTEGVEFKRGVRDSRLEFSSITNAGTLNSAGSRNPIQVRGSNNDIFDNTIDTAPSVAIGIGTGDGVLTDGNNNTAGRNTASNIASGKMFFIGSGHTGNVVCDDNVAVAPVVIGVPTTSCP
jgi:hypothetical protein